jgi:nucleotide-binding universal stress UspA family protein
MTVTMPDHIPLGEYEEARDATTPAVFRTILAVCSQPGSGRSVVPVAAAVARLAGARIVTANVELPALRSATLVAARGPARRGRSIGPARETELPAGPLLNVIPQVARRERADAVAIAAGGAAGSADAVEIARRLLDAGTAVLAIPPLQGRQPRLAHIGIGYDGGRPAEAALEIARDLADAGRGDVAWLEIAYVDDPAPCEADDETLAPRRAAMIEWWLTELGRQVPAPVRPVRLIGDPAGELAWHSRGLDLLMVGTRGGSFLRRALTGSVSRSLIATTRCPLLIVPGRRGSARRARVESA